MHLDTVIKNGTIVTATDIYQADIGINNEKIVALGQNLEATNSHLINAQGKYIFPGGIDVHTHLDIPINTISGKIFTKDDFATGTIAAACGGTTTIVDHCFQDKGQTLTEALNIWHGRAQKKAVIDYGFHVGISDFSEAIMEEMASLIKNGYPSYKVYMTYSFRLNDEEILRTLACARDNGGLVCVHAENFYIINYLIDKFKKNGKNSPKYHPLSRPPIAEAEATNRVIKLAELINAPLYIVHVTCRESLKEIRRARKSGGKIMGETCPQYLLLSIDNYDLPDFYGAKYVLSPPLRSQENQADLWEGLIKGDLAVVATDHCPFDFQGQKDIGRDFFSDIPNGIPGIELRMPLLFDCGVNAGKISLQKFVAITSTNPAKIFGMYPQKGSIAIGSDADLVIFDPTRKITIKKSILHENVDYTPYEGLKINGYPVATLSRGKLIVKDGNFIGNHGDGRFLPRKNIEIL
ncbi:phenylhydantoinase [Gammaproteobacteria bacterium]